MTLTARFEGDAWEFFYALIADYAAKQLTVTLTTYMGDEIKCELERVEGDVHTQGSRLVVRGLHDDRNELSLPLFAKSGECTITGIQVL